MLDEVVVLDTVLDDTEFAVDEDKGELSLEFEQPPNNIIDVSKNNSPFFIFFILLRYLIFQPLQ